MESNTPKDTPKILNLLKAAQKGDSRAEDTLISIYQPYVDFMVRRYSKKTDIKDDDDLESCVKMGLLEGIRRFDPRRKAKFIYFAHIWMKKSIFIEEATFRFIRVPVNQKAFYDSYLKELQEYEHVENDHTEEDIQKFELLDNTKIGFFSDFMYSDEESGADEFPEHMLKGSFLQPLDENNISIETLKRNIKKVLSNFNDKEIFIIEHLFGLNGAETLSSEQIAKKLSVTKVNITFTKTRVIRLLRHSSLSNQLLDGI